MRVFEPFLDLFISLGDDLLKMQSPSVLKVQQKDDGSPVSSADLLSHQVICNALESLGGGLPVISEEGVLLPQEERASWDRYWVLDPLDGTRDYIAGSDNFAICLARIQNGVPDIGMIYSPAKNLGYFVAPDQEVWVWQSGEWTALTPIDRRLEDPYTIISNFSYSKPRLMTFLSELEQSKWGRSKSIDHVSMSSALKFGEIACGRATLYPKLGPIMQWDIAAGYAILCALNLPFVNLDGSSLTFSAGQLKQHGFFAGDDDSCLLRLL